jgi:glycosyltransferase involved in cell wall biosynthesis
VKTIHFVYAGNPHIDHRNSPYTITRHLYQHLTTKYDQIHYYDWQHTGPIAPVNHHDTILAHPNYPPSTAARQLFRAAEQIGCTNRNLIFPLHHKMPEINRPFDDLVQSAKNVFSITGRYWYDTLGQSALAHWAPKITRLDMAIDTTLYPHVKHHWSPNHNRQFVYIGADRPEKNLDLLADIFSRCHYTLHTYGMIGNTRLLNLPNVHHHGYADTHAQFARDLCAFADVFLNTSRSDANPTTLLEAAAWGLVVACTPQSGYYGETSPFWGLNLENVQDNINLLQYAQTCPEDALRSQAKIQRKRIETDHTWDKFVNTITDKLLS